MKTRPKQRTFEQLPEHYESKFEPSMTVQGEATDVETLVRRYSEGLELPRRPVSYLDEDFTNPEAFINPDVDLSDLDKLQARKLSYQATIEEHERIEKEKNATS